MRILTVIIVALAAVGPAIGAEPAKWERVPSRGETLAVYPPRALAEQLGGKAVVDCAVGSDGALSDCHSVSEEPSGYGFGDAAIALASKLRRVNPVPSPGRIRVPLRFDPPPPRREPIFQVMANYRQYGRPGPYYPEMAQRQGVTGSALIHCRLSAAGKLLDCLVADETPAGSHFGEASLKMAERGWVTAQPRLVDGVAVDGEPVEVLIPFDLKRRIH